MCEITAHNLVTQLYEVGIPFSQIKWLDQCFIYYDTI